MKAMILAAGLGTRLKPVTDHLPKALVPLGGKPLLYHVLMKLNKAGVNAFIVNVHHHHEQISRYLSDNDNFGFNIEISYETDLLDTGGGLKKAAWFFEDNVPFILHNVDVISSIDLKKMYAFHLEREALVTAAVKQRETSRYLLFDDAKNLVGWRSKESGETRLSRKEKGSLNEWSFLGIHVISPEIFSHFPKESRFSIIEFYLSMAKETDRITAYDCNPEFWLDLGRKENFTDAEKFVKSLPRRNH
ncbi:MAG: nucleotidyltransferase family protein [Calditrichales bacterium]|nr:MAG: nucleotidyltransferase family protein [Calditrichales bacterium]